MSNTRRGFLKRLGLAAGTAAAATVAACKPTKQVSPQITLRDQGYRLGAAEANVEWLIVYEGEKRHQIPLWKA